MGRGLEEGKSMDQIDGQGRINTGKKHIAATLAVMAFIFVHSAMPGRVSGSESGYFAELLSSITGIGFDTSQFIVRKAAHFTEYLVLGSCLTVNFFDLKTGMALSRSERKLIRDFIAGHPQLSAWIAGTLYAASDEFHQLFVEGRTCAFRDVCIDSAGAAAGILIASVIKRRCRRK